MTERILGDPGPKRHRRVTAARTAVLLGILTAFLVVFVASSGAQLSGSTFESNDGNLRVQSGKDWNSYSPTAADNFAVKIDDGYEYAGGMKHDDACPSLNGPAENVHTKSDFTRMYIAYEDVGANTFLYLSWQRIVQNSTSNSAHASFIFAQSDENCANGQTPVRTEDDMLITFDFEGGAGDAIVALSRWITSGSGSDCESNYQNIPAAGCWSDVTTFPVGSSVGQGAVNTRSKNTAECVVSKNPLGAVADAHQGNKCLGELEFGEAAVNLSAAGVFDSAQDCLRFGSVHVGSRASGNSFDAQLKDLLRPLPIELTNCAGIRITKTDDLGNPLEGVTFTLHEDDNGEPGDATDFSCTTDEDGVCTIEDVLVGSYCVVETNLPDGYDPDPDLPYCFEVTEDDVDTTIDLDFENPRQLHRVIVLVCHEVDDTLYPSDVTVDVDGTPTTKESLDNAGLTEGEENALCQLGGATFGGFGHEEVDATIDIGTH
jgi:hypothetical protein